MNFARPFRLMRAELRITQFEFSRLLEVSQSFLSKIERGLLDPTAEVFVRGFHIACRRERECPLAKRAFVDLLYPESE